MLNRYIFTVFALLFAGVLYSFSHNGKDGYKLVWADEFNKEGAPDSSVWSYEKGFVRNHEDQWYRSENAYCKDGKLVIEAKRVHIPNPNYKEGSSNWKSNRQWINYTSASLNTRVHKSWQYGRFVMRARFDTSGGLWPAFWTLGVSKPWPSNGEIDIMEYYREHLLANIACGTNKPSVAKWYSNRRLISSFNTKDWSNKFHVWRMDWDKKEIRLYVDDILMNKVPLDSLYNPDGSNPFMQPHYILLNLAIGGDNGGSPDETIFPKRYEIDYVRVYQKE
ncbi:beta-glucanase [Arachidicoccus ginsenosidimutans]|nr:beta-glucanase [Arachidicoccus sp. BS20]